MSSKIYLSKRFQREAKKLTRKYPSLAGEIRELIGQLTHEPHLGNALKRGARKIRLAIRSKGKGKRGGGRVITLVQITHDKESELLRVNLVSIFDKSKKATVNDAELSQMIDDILAELKVIEEE